jgi:very-short-patch-repair endonuclease
MNAELQLALASGSGLLTSADARRTASAHALGYAVRAGQLTRRFPGVYLDAVHADDPHLVRRAALHYARGRAALSHLTALQVWNLLGRPESAPPPEQWAVHLTVAPSDRLKPRPGLAVHRRVGFRPEPPLVRQRAGLVVVPLERAVVEGWPLLPAADRREPAILAVQRRLTTPPRLAAELAACPRLAGRAELNQLIELLDIGCHSQLELWGHGEVFTGPEFADLRHQVPMTLDNRRIYLDLYSPATRVNFELDGAANHSSVADRERDIRRDSALAARNILVVRFSHRRLTREPDAVRAEAARILVVRLRRAA